MINEGPLANDPKTLVKSEMIRQIRQLGPTTPERWERAVFETLTRHRREDVDWTKEDNHAGYYTWIKSFDQLIGELVDDGYVRETAGAFPRTRTLVPVEADPAIDFPQLAYPPR
jgi:hypothetical protein